MARRDRGSQNTCEEKVQRKNSKPFKKQTIQPDRNLLQKVEQW